MTLAYTQQSATSTADNCFYVFNRGTADGYIIVSADDRTDAILGYTDSGSFNYASLPANARWWFSEYQRQIQYLIDHPNYEESRIAPKLYPQASLRSASRFGIRIAHSTTAVLPTPTLN
jgi:hypothetical protein